jgi:hypothetical protein
VFERGELTFLSIQQDLSDIRPTAPVIEQQDFGPVRPPKPSELRRTTATYADSNNTPHPSSHDTNDGVARNTANGEGSRQPTQTQQQKNSLDASHAGHQHPNNRPDKENKQVPEPEHESWTERTEPRRGTTHTGSTQGEGKHRTARSRAQVRVDVPNTTNSRNHTTDATESAGTTTPT